MFNGGGQDESGMDRERDSLQMLRHDLTSHAKTLSAIIQEQGEMRKLLSRFETDAAVRVVRDKHMEKQLGEISKDLQGLYSLGKWIIMAFGAAFIAAAAQFIIRGGLGVPLS